MIKIDEQMISDLAAKASASPRKRMNYNFHQNDSDTLQRMLNAMEPETYIQPHKHELPDKTEAFFCLRGKLLVVEYDDFGAITDHVILDHSVGKYGCEIAPRKWHSIICIEPGSVAYEVKDGPYDAKIDKHFASWAPNEYEGTGLEFNKMILNQLGL